MRHLVDRNTWYHITVCKKQLSVGSSWAFVSTMMSTPHSSVFLCRFGSICTILGQFHKERKRRKLKLEDMSLNKWGVSDTSQNAYLLNSYNQNIYSWQNSLNKTKPNAKWHGSLWHFPYPGLIYPLFKIQFVYMESAIPSRFRTWTT